MPTTRTAPAPVHPPTLSNADVGRDIGLAHSTVSRIRSGDRHPSLDVMLKIEEHYGWSLNDQAKARGTESGSTYNTEFEKVLTRVATDRLQKS